MAKNKKTSKKTGVRKNVRRRSSGVTPYQSLLSDPCNASMFSPYGGEAGFVQRFVLDTTVNQVAGHTSGYMAFTPSSNAFLSYGNASSSVAGVPAFLAGPGYTYLAANANKMRAIAACITIIPSATSYNNLTGEIGTFTTTSDSITTLTSLSADSVLTLSNYRTVLSKQSYEVKWAPGSLDHTFNVNNAGTFTIGDAADANTIGIVWRGYPAGVALTVRVTLVVEWTPKTALGIATTGITRAGVNHHAEVADLGAKHPGWWSSVAHAVGKDLGMGVQYLARRGIAAGVSYAERNLMPVVAGLLM